MSVTPQQFAINVKRFESWLVNNLNRDATVKGALTMAMQIRDRVEQRGQKASGGQFKGYSTKPTLVGRKSFTGKGAWDKVYAMAKNPESGLKWVTTVEGYRLVVLPGGYAQIRQLEGRQTAFKSFNRTSFMWAGFGVKPEKTTKTSVFLGGRNKDSQNKINWNTAREKEVIIYPSDKEIKALTDYVAAVVVAKMKEML